MPKLVHQIDRHLTTDRPARVVRFCAECADLAHRRPASGCPECKRPHIAARPVTLDYVHSQQRPDARVMP